MDENLTFKENQDFKIPIKIISSNSNSNTVHNINLPDKVTFDSNNLLFSGRILNHGFYQIKFQITDGLIKKDFVINLQIMPANPLEIEINKIIEVTEKEKFSIPFKIVDNSNIYSTIKLINPSNENIVIKTNCLEGIINSPKQLKISIEISDKYNRKVVKEISLSILPQRQLNLKWVDDSSDVEYKNYEGSIFYQNIQAVVIENNLLNVKHSISAGYLPANYEYSSDGILKGIIDGKEYNITVQAEIKNKKITKSIRVKTIVLSRISSISKDKSLGTAFQKLNLSNENPVISENEVKQDDPLLSNVFKNLNPKKEEIENKDEIKSNSSVKLGSAFKKKEEKKW
ncbi:MAG: hypothetical protein IPG24_27070 [Leptospiraceae bacterium]|nr:hypothetical protein [Leptospiraceae bacterium]